MEILICFKFTNFVHLRSFRKGKKPFTWRIRLKLSPSSCLKMLSVLKRSVSSKLSRLIERFEVASCIFEGFVISAQSIILVVIISSFWFPLLTPPFPFLYLHFTFPFPFQFLSLFTLFLSLLIPPYLPPFTFLYLRLYSFSSNPPPFCSYSLWKTELKFYIEKIYLVYKVL